MLMYGSSFWRETLRPRAFRMVPIDAAVIPLPMEETTPPVTKTYFGTGILFYPGQPSAARCLFWILRRVFHGAHDVVRSSSVSLRPDRQLRDRRAGLDQRRHRLVLLPAVRLPLHLRRHPGPATRRQLPGLAPEPRAGRRAGIHSGYQPADHHL